MVLMIMMMLTMKTRRMIDEALVSLGFKHQFRDEAAVKTQNTQQKSLILKPIQYICPNSWNSTTNSYPKVHKYSAVSWKCGDIEQHDFKFRCLLVNSMCIFQNISLFLSRKLPSSNWGVRWVAGVTPQDGSSSSSTLCIFAPPPHHDCAYSYFKICCGPVCFFVIWIPFIIIIIISNIAITTISLLSLSTPYLS